jgi:hypothetical protein
MDRWLRQLALRASVGAARLGRTADTRIFRIEKSVFIIILDNAVPCNHAISVSGA